MQGIADWHIQSFWLSLSRLLIAKLYFYGFEKDSLRLIHNYLVGKKQRVKIDNEYSTQK